MANAHMRRIIAHWTAGRGRASASDKQHYHRLTEYDGTHVRGTEAIEDNITTGDGDYAAHTLRLNTGSIGVAMCGMHNAKETPFDAGPSPINEPQFHAFCQMIASLCLEYGIPVTPETVLTHAEVEPTLGVKQKGKWDMTRLPWKPELRGARPVGDYLRSRVNAVLGSKPVIATNRPTLRFGDQGVAVAELQTDMAALGYFSGRMDGDFGPLTRAALLAFQADNGLATDAIAGAMTWRALGEAKPRPMRAISQAEIDAESGTAKDARMVAVVGDIIGVGGVAGIAKQAQKASETVEAASGLLGTLSATVVQYWPALVFSGGCVVAWLALRALSGSQRKRRLRDAREGRSLAR
ncbi:Putative peptidoglycan binding domain protein [Pelagimonas phthalicica]|uniref:Putative peptidoglycan binding domain protein n=1 Tax=Pelagimonas phthalicica TaxID=1037362 RepID=A0A238J9F0_9RHOB|nr:peptidoglycan-binding domain-containing protein [Pelagimonas phthalicica]TDS94197.1 N-acetylmuramoyl-L-alanine amidase [Pelagimonas phthalicica]SMX27278.1 Putative peptidoglycan binding domain protein [Pelagimonas phthalicica]